MGSQTTNFPDWQFPNSKKGRFLQESSCKSCNFGQKSTKLSEKLKDYDKLKVTKKDENFSLIFFQGRLKTALLGSIKGGAKEVKKILVLPKYFLTLSCMGGVFFAPLNINLAGVKNFIL